MIPVKSALHANYSKFIYFHPSTKGTAGRAVFINPGLLVRFMELVDTRDPKGELIARGIIALQSTAAGTTSDSNQSCAFQHRQTVQNLVVTYTILQTGGRGAGVYITDLQHGYSGKNSNPGLYKVQQSSGGRTPWEAVFDQSASMPCSYGVLGALPPNDDGLIDVDKTATTFAEGPLKPVRRAIATGFSLFYTPTHVVDGMGHWLTSEQKHSGGAATVSRSFAQLLANTDKTSQNDPTSRHTWYIVGQGAKVFQQALQEYKRLTKHPLNRKHDFYFVDPQVPLGLLQKDLRECGIDLNRDKNIIHTSMSLASQVHQLADNSQMYLNMHRPWEREVAMTSSLNEVEKLFDARNPTAYFSEMVKKLSAALKGRW